ncbi:MAG: hypothetical protein ACKKL4_02735 [Patescibacteria group bacterium]
MNKQTATYNSGNIFVIIIVIIALAISGYFIYQQIAPTFITQDEDPETNDFDMLVDDLDLDFNQEIDMSAFDELEADLQALEELDTIEIEI